tara:strand:+ start:1760 stop:2410 length:651 start_codon:yes stop_codon:yes gene_type:complete
MDDSFAKAYESLVHALAYEYARRYPMVETQDIAQTLWLWFVSHPNKLEEWQEHDEKSQEKLIAKSLRNAALKYCEKEKARITGYEFIDVYYYDASVIETFLPTIVAESYEIPSKIKDLNFKPSKGESSDGNNWLVLRSDIATGYYKLSAQKQNVLKIRFSQESNDWAEIAKDLDSTPDGARMKVQRAVNSLIRNLGGWKPQIESDRVAKETDGRTD